MIISSPREAVNHANIELRDGHRVMAHFITELAGHQLDRLYTYSLEGRKNRNVYVFENGFVKVGNTLELENENMFYTVDDAILDLVEVGVDANKINFKNALIGATGKLVYDFSSNLVTFHRGKGYVTAIK